jgi:TonB family protein
MTALREPIMRKLLVLQFFALATVLAAPAARADLYAATQAYQNKEYEKSFTLYRELAELGQLEAQEIIAVMYVNGEGVKRDNVAGYAWAKIALENGGGEAVKGIIAQLDPHMTDKARQRVEAITAQFGRDALEERLMPKVLPGTNFMTQGTPCRISRQATNIYPPGAVDSGIQGHVYVEFTVMPDGRARNPRVIYAVPGDVFDDSTRRLIMRSEFTPATEKGVPVPCTLSMMVSYKIEGAEASDYDQLQRFMKRTKEQAEAGDAHSQMLYGLLISGLPQVRKPRGDAMPYFVKAAQAGLPTAQFMVGYSSMMGWGCECSEPKGLVWLHKAAAADQADAQVMLANYILRGEPTPEETAKAMTWLERAVASGNRDGKFYLAALLAAGVDAGRHDPGRALKVLKDVMRDVDDDPTAFEIRAAAHAMLGDFEEALKDQKRALKMAQKLGWETASQQQRLAQYSSGRAWTGDLFAF